MYRVKIDLTVDAFLPAWIGTGWLLALCWQAGTRVKRVAGRKSARSKSRFGHLCGSVLLTDKTNNKSLTDYPHKDETSFGALSLGIVKPKAKAPKVSMVK